jgi:GNAT superfamily N-acetyltransferase
MIVARQYERALAIERRNLHDTVRLLGDAAPGSRVWERDGLAASVVPSSPHCSAANVVTYTSADSLVYAIEEITAVYADADVRGWRVWVPNRDERASVALAAARFRPAARLPAMVLDLDRFVAPDLAGLEYDSQGDVRTLGRINAQANEDGEGLAAALSETPDGLGLRIYRAMYDAEVASVLCTIDRPYVDDVDCGVSFVATVSYARRRGLATRLVAAAMVEARERGCHTSSLQASPMGTAMYSALGWQTAFRFYTWERF